MPVMGGEPVSKRHADRRVRRAFGVTRRTVLPRT